MSNEMCELEAFADKILKIKLTQSQKDILREIEKSAPKEYRHTYTYRKKEQLKLALRSKK